MNSVAFSKDGKQFLTYTKSNYDTFSSRLNTITDKNQVYLISSDETKREITIDLAEMIAAYKDRFSFLATFLDWDIEWFSPQILRIILLYGEVGGELPSSFVGYYDISLEKWWIAPIENLTPAQGNDWTNISPDLTFALYIDDNFTVFLWDMLKKEIVWTGGQEPYVRFAPSAVWSPDNQGVAFHTQDQYKNIQIISRDGQQYRMTKKIRYASPKLEFIPGQKQFAWSPAGRYLAIAGTIQDSQTNLGKSILYVYDTGKDSFIYKCPMGSKDKNWNTASNILWSPDGNYIVPTTPEAREIPFRLYDLRTKKVYQIQSPGYFAVAWLSEFPWKENQ